MNIVACVVFITLVATRAEIACAADWQNVPGNSVKADLSRIEVRKDGSRRVWQRYTLDPTIVARLQADLRSRGSAVNYDGYAYSVALWEYHCKDRLIGVVSTADYDGSGRVVNSSETDPPERQRAIPESDGENTLEFVCAWRNQRNPKK